MDWGKFFKKVDKKEFFETIERHPQYIKINRIVNRLNETTDKEYIVMEDWDKKSPYINTKDKDSIWMFFKYAFGDIKMINNDMFYIKTEFETTFLYISAILIEENNEMVMKVLINLKRCYRDGRELYELEETGGYIMKKKGEEVCEKIAEQMSREKCARKIQRKCENWLWKPVCGDGNPGINVKIGWKECEKIIKKI